MSFMVPRNANHPIVLSLPYRGHLAGHAQPVLTLPWQQKVPRQSRHHQSAQQGSGPQPASLLEGGALQVTRFAFVFIELLLPIPSHFSAVEFYFTFCSCPLKQLQPFVICF